MPAAFAGDLNLNSFKKHFCFTILLLLNIGLTASSHKLTQYTFQEAILNDVKKDVRNLGFNSTTHFDCHPSCFTCYGTTENNCLTCSEKRSLTKLKSCACPDLMYDDHVDKKCLNIPSEIRQLTIFIYVLLILIGIFSFPFFIGNRTKHLFRLLSNYQNFFIISFLSVRYIYKFENILNFNTRLFFLDFIPNPFERMIDGGDLEKERTLIQEIQREEINSFRIVIQSGYFRFFLINAGSLLLICLTFIVVYEVVEILSKFSFNEESLFKRLLKELRWSLFIRLFEITLLPMTLFIALEIRRLILFNKIVSLLDFTALLICILGCLTGLFATINVVRKTYYIGSGKESEDYIRSFINSYGVLTSDLKIDKIASLTFIIVQLLKKIMVSVVIVVFIKDASLQIFSLIALNSAEFLYVLIFKPFMRTKYNISILVNNILTVLVLTIIYGFHKNYQFSSHSMKIWALFISVLILIHFSANFSIVIFNLMFDLNHIITHIRNISSTFFLGLQATEFYRNQVNTYRVPYTLNHLPPPADIDSLIPTPHALVKVPNIPKNIDEKLTNIDLELSSSNNQTFECKADQISFYSNCPAIDGSPTRSSYSGQK